MKFLLITALLAGLLIAGEAQVVLTTCARMNDGPIFAKAAEVACSLSCKYRSCNNSKCVFRSGRPVCECSRCSNG